MLNVSQIIVRLKFFQSKTPSRLTLKVCLLIGLASSLFACDDEPNKRTKPDFSLAGEVQAGQESGGQLVAGEVSGGEVDESRSQLESVEVQRSINLTNLSAPVEVIFTEGMVPNIYAENEADLGKVLGYLLARDRFFNMDLVRRLAQGRVSELFGDVGLSTDMESLGLGMGLVTERLATHTSGRAKAYLTAVADGINEYIAAVRRGEEEPPSEFKLAAPLFGTQAIELMQPWTATDIISMATSILYQTNFEDKDISATERFLQLESIYGEDQTRREAFVSDVALNMTPPVDGNSTEASPTWGVSSPWNMTEMEETAGEQAGVDTGATEGGAGTMAGEQAEMAGALTGGMSEMREGGAEPPPENKGFLQNHNQVSFHSPIQNSIIKKVSLQRLEKLRTKLAQRHGWFGKDFEAGFGSNAWAAGQSATSAGAIVSGDGHLQLSVPSIMYQVGLNTEALGGGDIHQKGLLIASIPVLAVGTNGKVAWSQVNPVVDITDWYVEKLQLDESGRPKSSYFQGEWRDLLSREETVNVAERRLLGSDAQTVTWQSYSTFDGRRFVEIEGREFNEEEELAQGESIIVVLGTRIVPSDIDGDGEITAVSFDYTAFDATGFVDSLFSLGLAQNIEEFETQTKRLIGGGLFSAAGDSEGHILYTSYQSIPCRSYLERDANGLFLSGQSPMALLDGTQIGGFTILSDEQGYVDESQNNEPYTCAIPYDQMPLSKDPIRGFISTANNDPQGFADDGRVDNDAWYLGGPWAPFRQNTIKRALSRELDRGAITIESMRRIQANHDSRLGELFTPSLIELGERLNTWSQEGINDENPSKQRALTLYNDHKTRIQEAIDRLKEWKAGAYQAQSGVESFYNAVDERELKDAVATSIFNAYFRSLLPKVWNDEAEGAIPYDGTRLKIYALERMLRGRGAGNPLNLASWSENEQESIFFDRLDTPEQVERSEELMVSALIDGLDSLSAEVSNYGEGGFGSENMEDWLWGLHHMARFESLLGPFLGDGGPFDLILNRFAINTDKIPLADNIPEDDPRTQLKWFPRAGDQWAIDAANPGFGGGYTFSNGPVMRMTIQLNGDQVQGYNIIPGGQSGLENNPNAADQLKLWLANEAYPIRYHLPEVIQGAVSRWQFNPNIED